MTRKYAVNIGVDFSKVSTEKLKSALDSYREALKSGFDYGDYDLCSEMIEDIETELEARINSKDEWR